VALKKLDPVGYLASVTHSADSVYVYGASSTNLTRTTVATMLTAAPDTTNIFNFKTVLKPDALFTQNVMAGPNYGLADGEVFVIVKGQDEVTWEMFYSSDSGVTFVDSMALTAGCYVLDRGISKGTLSGDGSPSYMLIEYNGSTGANCRITKTTDPTQTTWTELADFVSGVNIRHGHVCKVADGICYISVGDGGAQAATFAWDGKTTIVDDVTMAELIDDTLYGVTSGIHSTQHARTVDLLVDASKLYWIIDSNVDEALDTDVGIWRANKDFTSVERVDVGHGRKSPVTDFPTGWTGVLVDGHVVFCEDPTTTGNVATTLYVSLYAADDANTALNQWREVGRIYSRNLETQNAYNRPKGIWATNDLLGFSFGAGSGKYKQGETSIMEFSTEDFVDNELGPDITNLGMTYPDTFAHAVHPVFWVDPASGNDSNDGYFPATPRLTVNSLINANPAEITYGTNIIVTGAINETLPSSLAPNWQNFPDEHPNPTLNQFGYSGESGHPVQITGTDISTTQLITAGSTGLNLNNSNHFFYLDSMKVFSEAGEPNRGVIVAVEGASCNLIDSQLGDIDESATSLFVKSAVTTPSLFFNSVIINGVTVEGSTMAKPPNFTEPAWNPSFFPNNRLYGIPLMNGEDGDSAQDVGKVPIDLEGFVFTTGVSGDIRPAWNWKAVNDAVGLNAAVTTGTTALWKIAGAANEAALIAAMQDKGTWITIYNMISQNTFDNAVTGVIRTTASADGWNIRQLGSGPDAQIKQRGDFGTWDDGGSDGLAAGDHVVIMTWDTGADSWKLHADGALRESRAIGSDLVAAPEIRIGNTSLTSTEMIVTGFVFLDDVMTDQQALDFMADPWNTWLIDLAAGGSPTLTTPYSDQSNLITSTANIDLTTNYDNASTFTVTGLPAGLSSANGVVTGTVTAPAGPFTVTVVASSGSFADVPQAFTWNVLTAGSGSTTANSLINSSIN